MAWKAALLALASLPLVAAELRVSPAGGTGVRATSSDAGPSQPVLSWAAILIGGAAAAAFLLLDWQRRRQRAVPSPRSAAQQQRPLDASLQGQPAQPVQRQAAEDVPPQPQRATKGSARVAVAARAGSMEPPAGAMKVVNLALPRSLPAAVSPFAAAARTGPELPQALPLAAAAAQPLAPQWQQQSPFSAAPAVRAASPVGAHASPFATAAARLSDAPSTGSSEPRQWGSAGSDASGLARRPSPPHLSTMLGALPLFASGSGESALATAPPPASPPARPHSPGGRRPAAYAPSPDRISLEQLKSEILGDEATGSVSQLEQMLSGLPAAADAAGPPGGALQPAPSGSPDAEWEIAPNELEICKRPDGSLWQLGAGGFGRVYRAMRFGCTPVAVKVMAPTGDALPSMIEDFKREALLLQRCKDPHIVSFLGASLSTDFTILVTEYCEGGALSANLAAGRITWYRRGKQVALDIARGLVFLHCRGILHFDLKSQNILLDRRGTAKIADLGLAKMMHHERSTVTGNLGTLNWAAPELLMGLPCNEAADIYRQEGAGPFGVVLWEICTGMMPTRGRMRPLDAPADCPAEVAQLVEECMRADPQARPTAQQLVERLQAALGSPPGGAPAASPGAARPCSPSRCSLDLGRPAAQVAAALLSRHGNETDGRRASTGDLATAARGSPTAAGRPPLPRSEASLASPQDSQLGRGVQAMPAVPEQPEQHPSQPRQQAQPAAPAARAAQPQAQPQLRRPASPLPPARSVASDTGLAGATAPASQVAAAVVAAQQMDRGASLPAPVWGDAWGLGIF